MAEPYETEVQAAVDAAGAATTLDDKAAVALAGSFYKNARTGETNVRFGAGWAEIMRVSPEGGYDGLALHHQPSKTLVIVNRGTEGITSLADWMQNVGSALFNAPGPQMDSALELLTGSFETLGGDRIDRILIVGHSLGGALADAQGALAGSLFAARGVTCPPVKVVGVASAGFAHAAQILAAERQLQIAPDAKSFITHYIRAADAVPHHLNRSIFGTDKLVASVYETRSEAPPNAKTPGMRQWRWLPDLLKQHMRTLYFQFIDLPAERHVWFSENAKSFEIRDGKRPSWKPRMTRPTDW